MKLRFVVCTLFACILSTCEAVKMQKLKVVPKKNCNNLLKAKCVYKIKKAVPAATFKILFDKPTTQFKSIQAKVVSQNGNTYNMVNKVDIVPRKYVVKISVLYNGDEIPTGTCSELIPSGNGDSVTSAPVTVSMPYAIQATITNSWRDGDGTRVDAYCDVLVNTDAMPKTYYFGISFGMNVDKFEHWVGETIPMGQTSGAYIYVTNVHWVHPPNMKYLFQATYYGDQKPNIVCNSQLPEYTTTTQAPVTTTAAPVTTTAAPVTTTKAPVTTTETPTTTTKAPATTTKAPITTTEIPVTTTKAPVTTTKAPVTTTETPTTTTKAPATTTKAPITTTEIPVTTTKAPVTTTKAPVTTTKAPVTTTKAPVTTTKAPVTTTKAPVTTTQPPVTTTGAPVTTTQAPENTSPSTQPPTTTDSQSTSVPMEVISDWLLTGNERRMNGKCTFNLPSEIPMGDFDVTLTLNTETHDYLDWSWNQIAAAANGRWYQRENKWNLNAGNIIYDFQLSYYGSGPLTGSCSTDADIPVTSPTDGPTNEPTTAGTTQPKTTIKWDHPTFNYADVISKSILFYAAQRSGELPADNPISWRGDSALGDMAANGDDLTGGWYDAGDNVKFNFPMAASTTLLGLGLATWPEAYDSAGLTAKMLDSIKWPLDYLLKCWKPDPVNPVYYAQVGNGALDHAFWGRAEDLDMERPVYSINKNNPGSDVAAETAAAFAIGSLVFRETDPSYADDLLQAAISLYDFADTYRGKYSDSIPEVTAFYNSWSGYYDEIMFASTLMYKATGDNTYVTKAAAAHTDGQFDKSSEKAWALSWDDKRIAGQLLMYDITGEQKYEALVQNFLARYRGEAPSDNVMQTPGGLAWRDTWGSLRYAANAAFLSLMAADLGIDVTANRQWAASQINYILGDNPRVGDFSYVIGFGDSYPLRPHHGGASCPDQPATCDWANYNYNGPNPQVIVGALVGGPDSSDNYKDERHNFQTNEVACDYNAGFQSALAGLVQLYNGNSSTLGTSGTTKVTSGTTKQPITTNEPATTTTRVTTPTPDGEFDYGEVIQKSILFYRAQRSGHLPDDPSLTLSWRGDSALYDGSDVGLNLTGGWYDAGDYVKFNFPISSATAILAWGAVQWKNAYQVAGEYTNMLDSIKWSLDFFLKCWIPENQEFYAQVGKGSTDHDYMGRPEDMTASTVPRPAYKVTTSRGGSDVAGSVVAAFAAGSIAFKATDAAYSATLLDAARSLYIFADLYRAKYTDEVSDANSFYPSSGYKDELLYAAISLYKATGEAGYLVDAEGKYAEFGFDYQTSWAFDWSDKLMAAKLLMYEATGDSKYSRDVTSFLSQWRPGGSVQYTQGGLAWRGQWGSLRYSANTAFIALMAADMGIDKTTNIDWAEGQIHYMLGDNPRQSSYVVGFGNNPPLRPHHKASVCKPSPAQCDWALFDNQSVDNANILYGALVGGPDAGDNYVDDRTDYIMAEVTCDYNAGFQSSVAALLHFRNQS